MASTNGIVANGIVVKISFDLDKFDASEFTWGDMEDLQEGKFAVMRLMIERYAIVEGIPEGGLTNYLRGLKFSETMELASQLVAIINEKQNPSKNGKNSVSASLPTSTRGKVRRR
jgi:hypothetical protein